MHGREDCEAGSPEAVIFEALPALVSVKVVKAVHGPGGQTVYIGRWRAVGGDALADHYLRIIHRPTAVAPGHLKGGSEVVMEFVRCGGGEVVAFERCGPILPTLGAFASIENLRGAAARLEERSMEQVRAVMGLTCKRIPIAKCPRCGGAHDEAVAKALTVQRPEEGGAVGWAMCPRTLEPVLVIAWPAEGFTLARRAAAKEEEA